MRKIKYTNEAIEKLQEIKENISEIYGERVANNIVGKITKSIYELQQFAYIGSSAESVTGIPCNYRVLFVQHNYIFYTVQEASVIIVGIFNEKENFLWKLLKVSEIEDENDAFYDEESKKFLINESSPKYG